MKNEVVDEFTENYVWNIVLNLRYEKDNQLIHRQGVWSYSSFEAACENYLKAIRRYADNENEGFTFFRDLQQYLESLSPEWFLSKDDKAYIGLSSFRVNGYEQSAQACEKARKIPKTIFDLITKGRICPNQEDYCSFTDDKMRVRFEEGRIEVTEDYDGPVNGVNPQVLINFFTLDDPEKEYVFQIVGGFSHKELEKNFSFSVNLVKTTVDEPF